MDAAKGFRIEMRVGAQGRPTGDRGIIEPVVALRGERLGEPALDEIGSRGGLALRRGGGIPELECDGTPVGELLALARRIDEVGDRGPDCRGAGWSRKLRFDARY